MPNSRRRAYIIDDEPEIRDGLTLLLSTAAITVTGHASAEAYLASAPDAAPAAARAAISRIPSSCDFRNAAIGSSGGGRPSRTASA